MRHSKVFVAVDALIVKTINNTPYVLLIKRRNKPYQNDWALPGGFVEEDEDLEDAVARELYEETTIEVKEWVQLKAFGKPNRDPRNRVVSIAYLGFAPIDAEPIAADDATAAQWFSVKELPNLAFDHEEIIKFALEKISNI